MKKTLLLLLAIVMLLAVCMTGCKTEVADKTPEETKTQTESKPSSETESASDEPEIVNNTYKTGMPIVKDPISLDIVVCPGTYYAPYNEMKFWTDIEEMTNLDLNFIEIREDKKTKVNLLFASEDYPDIMFNGADDTQILEASLGDAIYPLDDLITEYAPTWVNFFNEYPYGYKIAKMSDGKIWSLPEVRWEPANYGIRDQVMINVQWLSELGLEIPTTTDEFYNVLKAFKENAGVGSIPENVIPWQFSFMKYSNGTNIDLFNSFGIFVKDDTFISVDDNGKIVFAANDPKIKDALKFFNKLYEEELILPEVFTLDNNTYTAQIFSDPPSVGVYTRYFNDDTTEQVYDVMPPLYGPNGEKPQCRIQNHMVLRNFFTIFKNNKYPEASMRLAELLADRDLSIQAMYGPYGKWLEKKDDGTIVQLPFEGNEVYQDCPGNNIPFILTPDIFENFQYSGSQAQRAKNIKEVYSEFTVPEHRVFPRAVWNEDQTQRNQDISTDLKDYIKSTFADWIVNGGIDEGWDAYIEQLNHLRLEDYIALYQEVLDGFNK